MSGTQGSGTQGSGTGARPRIRGAWVWTLLAGLLLLAGAVVLVTASGDVRRESAVAGSVPVRVVSPPGDTRGPALVLSHGFAGSAAMMDPMASALARAGYVVVLPDLPGHGSNADPLAEGVLEPAVGAAVAAAAERTAGAVAVAGHSMGAGAVTSWAAAEGSATAAATIAISLPSAEDLPADPARPPNLLLLWGAAEQQRFVNAALDALALGHPGAQPATTYGSAADGTARRAVEIAGAEHISVVYRDQSAREIAAWVGGGSPRGDARWIGLVLVLAGGVMITRPLLAGSAGAGGAGPWRAVGWLGASVAAAGLGAALLQGPLEAVPVAVAGYLMGWFGSGAVVLAVAAGRAGAPAGTLVGLVRGVLAGAILAAALALPARLTWAAFALVGPRLWVLPLLLVVLGAWFWGEARVLHGIGGWRRAAVLASSRILVVAGLLAAVVVLGAPGFLTLTVPLVIPILGLLAVVAWWARDAAAGACAQAIPLALAIATTFPIVA